MRTKLHSQSSPLGDLGELGGSAQPPRSQQGFAVLVVLVLLLMTIALVLSNARVLAQLKSNLDQVEQRQLKQYHPPALVPARVNVDKNEFRSQT